MLSIKLNKNKEGFTNLEISDDINYNDYYFPSEKDTYLYYQFNYPDGYNQINEYYNRHKIIISPEYPLISDNLQEEPFYNLSINKNALRFQHTSQPLIFNIDIVNPQNEGLTFTIFWKFENTNPEDIDILSMGKINNQMIILKLRQKQFELEFLYPMITKPIIIKRSNLTSSDLEGWLMLNIKLDRIRNTVALYHQGKIILEYHMNGHLPTFDTIIIRPNVENIRFRKGKQVLLGLLDSLIYYNKPLSDYEINNDIHSFLLFRSSSPRMIGFEYPNCKGRYQYYYYDTSMKLFTDKFKLLSLIIPTWTNLKLEYQNQPYQNILNQSTMESINIISHDFLISLELNQSFLIELQKYHMFDNVQINNLNNINQNQDSRYQITIYSKK
jgi:hypothetical protein